MLKIEGDLKGSSALRNYVVLYAEKNKNIIFDPRFFGAKFTIFNDDLLEVSFRKVKLRGVVCGSYSKFCFGSVFNRRFFKYNGISYKVEIKPNCDPKSKKQDVSVFNHEKCISKGFYYPTSNLFFYESGGEFELQFNDERYLVPSLLGVYAIYVESFY